MNLLKWLGTVLFLLAGFLLALNIEISRYGFPLFLAGHLLFIYIFSRTKDTPMILQNVAFACIDISGIYRWFIA